MTAAHQHVSLDIGPYVALAKLDEDARSCTYVAAREHDGSLELARLRTLTRPAGSTGGARYLAEVRQLQSIEQRNLVRLRDVDEGWVALEWVQGRDLRTILTRFARAHLRSVGVAHLVTERVLEKMRQRLPVAVSLYIVRELTNALCALHDAGVVAGPMTASAVTVSWDGAVKLDRTAVDLYRSTATLHEAGPGGYAPDDARGDVWSAGVILWEMLAGRAIHRTDPRIGDVVARGEAPAALARVFAGDVDERVTSASELRQLLDEAMATVAPRFHAGTLADLLHDLFDGEARRDAARTAAWLDEARRRGAPSSRARAAAAAPARSGRVTAPRVPVAAEPARTITVADGLGPQALVGTLVDGRYRVEQLIGEGGMGWVFQVHHEQIGRRLAMKVLTPEHMRSPDVVERFRREARTAAAIAHPSIVEVTDSGELADGSAYFVMELLRGRELGTLTARGEALSVLRALGIARQLARALAAAHRAGIVHRDLKPENVFLVERDGNPDFVKVLDFGIATAPGPKERVPNLTRPGLVMGTPEYMAPEQALGGAADARSDVYSCAAILFELLAGSPPYAPGNPVDVLARKTVEDALPLGELAPHVPIKLQELVMRCLSRDPARRAQSMDEVVLELDRIERIERAERTAPIGVQALRTPPVNDVLKRNAPHWSWPRLVILVVGVTALAATTLAFLAK